ncbi:MAG TPA: acetate--CoA ligase [Deltaproteobacteria bacterium]|nr:acetate--CoA ligase [Candidatus Binatota bacterium]HIL12200.1 acetate--CoA ligase [Deltaproteobacteria bacterium]
MTEKNIESLLHEDRRFEPPVKFASAARVGNREEYDAIRSKAAADPEAFWASIAEELHWFRKWDEVLDWSNPPFAKWFVGAKTNISHNCLDRNLDRGLGDKNAIIWEGEPGDRREISYSELHASVCEFAGALLAKGIKAGDRIALYMPMVPELAIAMLACARIGATHSIVFGGFSADSLRDRINDAEAAMVITADGGWRRGKVLALKDIVDDAVVQCPSVKNVIVLKRCENDVAWDDERDTWWHDAVAGVEPLEAAAELDAEHPLFILYTSGTTGKPKGVVHSTGGYMTQAYITTRWIFDLKDDDIYWCTADIGWVTGHSYIVYGPLINGATVVMYEGAPDTPGKDRFWDIVERYGVTVLYTAPTAIRTFMKWGDELPASHDLSSLRLLGTVGEPINPEAWMWYRRVIGGDRCPIVDTWWQTETGAIMISPVPGAVTTKPGSATLPFPGIDAEVVDGDGQPVAVNQGGLLVIRKPWPGMLRTIYGDPERFKEQYWTRMPGMYFAGDGARRDEDGYFWIMGRIDDVMNVSGHRLGTMEVESALVSHEAVTEAAVVGRPDDVKGEAVAAFVTLGPGYEGDDELVAALRTHVGKEIGAFAKPDDIRFTDALPKTRSGKIMRRLLRDIAAGRDEVGDTTTLEDYSVLASLREDD